MKIFNKKIVLSLLVIFVSLGMLSGFNNNKPVIENKENNENKKFGIYIEKDNEYVDYKSDTVPEYYKYKFNDGMSYCEDLDGQKVYDVLSVNYDNSVTVTSDKTLYCNIFYDEYFRGTGYELPKSEPANLNANQGGMYRYQGSNDDVNNNYICFGTDDENICLQNEDKYMYRIIGVDENGRLKLIKKEPLKQMHWSDKEPGEKIDFLESPIYKAINGEDFLDNPNYIPKEWKEKIYDNTWTYGTTSEIDETGENMYLIETGQRETTWVEKANPEDEGVQSAVVTYDGRYYEQTVYYVQHENEKWTNTFTNKVSLMYAHDYLLSIGENQVCYPPNVEHQKCREGWMHINNSNTNLRDYEWTMTHYGFYPITGYYNVIDINNNGNLDTPAIPSIFAIRPVFYLKSGIYFEGKGTESKPYIIKESNATNYIESKNPNGLKLGMVRGGMYRYQGGQSDNVENYICFGTSNQDTCLKNPDKYMYRIIGIEAGSNRIKVIKKEALEETASWWDAYDETITFLKSNAFKTISGDKFLNNSKYLPYGWKEKISDNSWIYGDMLDDDGGANQIGEEIYKIETGKKDTTWTGYADKNIPGAKETVASYDDSPYSGETVYYTDEKGKWHETFNSKVSLMYIHDYYLSVGDNINCCYYEGKETYKKCKLGWMHLSNNDTTVPSTNEWTMSRYGWHPDSGYSTAHYIGSDGYPKTSRYIRSYSVRPVFYINSNVEIASGTGKDNDPFMITL